MTTTTFQEDIADAYSWYTIVTELDENGQLVLRLTTYDDATTKQDIYEQGVLRQVIRLDDTATSSGAKPWQSIET